MMRPGAGNSTILGTCPHDARFGHIFNQCNHIQ